LADFKECSLGDQLGHSDRCPGWIGLRYELIFNLYERIEMLPKVNMVSGHFDNVLERKSCDTQIGEQKSESIAKLHDGIASD
jgi:hypothetical protein